MKKVLVTLPNSIAGTLILNGFAQGFKANGCAVYIKDLRELTVNYIQKIKPDIIFGYDYGFLFSDDKELVSFITENQNQYKLIHYFADEPQGKYACVNKTYLYEDFKKIDAKTYMWDRGFVKDIEDSIYMPLAVNYKAYRPDEGKKYDISFVGRPLTEKRQKVLASLVRVFGKKLNIFCYEKHFLQSLDDMQDRQLLSDDELDVYKSCYRGFLKTEQDLANVYFNSKVNVNITLQGDSGLNYRVFEILASRGFLLTDDMGDIERNFVIAKELEVYKDIDDLIDKTAFYLKNIEIGQKIALLGFSNVAKSHSYTARVNKILSDLK